ncbi:MAG: hypothetical protein E7279_01290 [Lachnospiraceae bacterium]|nr:hypothetical protein [Lachnospiraceae bacterium]
MPKVYLTNEEKIKALNERKMNNFIAQIEKTLKDEHITQHQVAQALDISDGAWSQRIRKGHIRLNELYAIASLLNIDVKELFDM